MSTVLATSAAVEPESNLRHERDRFVAFAFAAADAFLETDRNLNIRFSTGATQWLLGQNPDPERATNVLRFVAEDHQKLLKAACRLAARDGRFGPMPIEFRHADGRVVRADVSGTFLPRHGGQFYLAIRARPVEGGHPDQAADKVVESAEKIDGDAFAQAVASGARAAVESGQDMSLTLLNLEGLDRLRDQLAPSAAIDLMSDIEAHLRSSSMGGSSVAQVGAEEFGLLHRGDLNVDGLEQGIGDCVSAYDSEGGGLVVRSTTVDITGTDLSEGELAKTIVYAINKFTESRGEFTVDDLSKGYKEMLARTSKKVVELKNLIRSRAFDLHYQPIVGLVDGAVHHHEVLVRFRADGENVSPYARITFAEEVGLIAALDLAICQRAIKVVGAARGKNLPLSLAVNVSGGSLETPIFVDRLHTLLKDCGPYRDHLLFEVTESSKINDLEATNNFLTALRKQGHKVCLDDFGAGASAFQYLRALSVDYVKIDGSYVRAVATSQDARSFLRSMTTFCHELGMQTIAEMIEDEATADILRKMGVGYGQGYLFGRPSPDFTGGV